MAHYLVMDHPGFKLQQELPVLGIVLGHFGMFPANLLMASMFSQKVK